MVDKLLHGEQIQVRLDASNLDVKNRKAWGESYIDKQIEKGRLFVSAAALSLASAASFIAGIQYESVFLLIAFVLGFYALKAFAHYGYEKAAIESWESKSMVRIDP